MESLERRELYAVVDPEHLHDCLRRYGTYRQPVLDRMGDNVGDEILALRIVAIHALEPTPQLPAMRGEDSGVDLRDVALLLVCIPLFDDSADVSVAVADDSAVPSRLVHHRGDERHAGASGQRRGLVQRRGIDERHVTIEHQHCRIIGNAGHRQRQRMTGTELLGLLHPFDVSAGHGFTHHPSGVSVNDMHARGTEPIRGLDDVGEQRATGEEMEDLRQARAHAPALPCRKDDHMQGCHVRGGSGFLDRACPSSPQHGVGTPRRASAVRNSRRANRL